MGNVYIYSDNSSIDSKRVGSIIDTRDNCLFADAVDIAPFLFIVFKWDKVGARSVLYLVAGKENEKA